MKKLFLFILAISCLQFMTLGQQKSSANDGKKVLLPVKVTKVSADSLSLLKIKPVLIDSLEIPKTGPKDIIIRHTGYSLLYNETHEQAAWVAYELTSEETNKIFERTDKFLVDPKIKTGSGDNNDFSKSGYDRGHLAPAADMGWSAASMSESFYYSNMSPQAPAFNRGIWENLEELVRTWAIENNSVYVITGPVLTSGLSTIGPNKVSVPDYFYKVVLDYKEPGIKGIGFILLNAGSAEPLQNFAVTIDSVEIITGIDFFPLLPDAQEAAIEKTLCKKCWTWEQKQIDNNSLGNKKVSTSVQCKGTTKDGDRCKNKTLNPSGYCNLHEYQQDPKSNNNQTQIKSDRRAISVQCSGTTKSGTRCKNMTYSPNGRCFQHGGD